MSCDIMLCVADDYAATGAGACAVGRSEATIPREWRTIELSVELAPGAAPCSGCTLASGGQREFRSTCDREPAQRAVLNRANLCPRQDRVVEERHKARPALAGFAPR
jgi:hypothetical protein